MVTKFGVGHVASSVGVYLSRLLERIGSPEMDGLLDVMGISMDNSLSCTAICMDTVRNCRTAVRSIGTLGKTTNCLEHRLNTRLGLEGMPRLHFITSSSVRRDTGVSGVVRSFGRSRW